MRINEEKIGQIWVLTIKGRVERIHAPNLRDSILSKINNNELYILLDLSDLDYISSAGLGIFIHAAKQIKERKGRIIFCSLRENIMEIFKIAGFIKILEIYKTREEAIMTLKGS
jgi:anti-anti-sigma factor